MKKHSKRSSLAKEKPAAKVKVDEDNTSVNCSERTRRRLQQIKEVTGISPKYLVDAAVDKLVISFRGIV